MASIQSSPTTTSAAVVLGCEELGSTLAFLRDQLGFRLDLISPADDPTMARLSGFGLEIELLVDAGVTPARIQLRVQGEGPLPPTATAPNGTVIEFTKAVRPIVIPASLREFVISRSEETPWVEGRAGMQYRDLIPGRLGGRFIASHISIPDGGPVADYVHHHGVRFQMIYCTRGWVRLVYEDQGEPFVMEAGDCVLQPPHIRHRVLEASPGMEVIEVGCPAVHDTVVEHSIRLPTPTIDRSRSFHGQRFVWHRAADAPAIANATESESEPTGASSPVAGTVARTLGLASATADLAEAWVLSPLPGAESLTVLPAAEFSFTAILTGTCTVNGPAGAVRLVPGDAVAVTTDDTYLVDGFSPDLTLLHVRLPGT